MLGAPASSGRVPSVLVFQLSKELTRRKLEGDRDLFDLEDAQRDQAVLDLAHVGAMNAGGGSKLFLRISRLSA